MLYVAKTHWYYDRINVERVIRYAHIYIHQAMFLSVAPNLSQPRALFLPWLICQTDQVVILLSSWDLQMNLAYYIPTPLQLSTKSGADSWPVRPRRPWWFRVFVCCVYALTARGRQNLGWTEMLWTANCACFIFLGCLSKPVTLNKIAVICCMQ